MNAEILPAQLSIAERLTRFLDMPGDGTFYVGHASILVRIAGKKFIVDPIIDRPLMLDAWLYYPPQAMDARYLDVDGVLISHFHEDHFDPRFLKQLRPGTPVYIIENRPILEGFLRELGLNVQLLPGMKLHQLAAGVEVLAMPSEYNFIDSSFLLRGAGLTVYQGNDNFLTRKTLDEARQIIGAVDHAFVPYAYSWWYPFCLGNIDDATRVREAERLVGKYLDLGLEHADALGARVAVPSGGNLVFYDHVDSWMNRYVYGPYDFVDYAHDKRADLAPRVWPLVGGDYLSKDCVFWTPSTRPQYKQRLGAFLDEKRRAAPPSSQPRAFTDEDVAFLRERLRAPEVPSLDYTLVFQRDDAPASGFRVDLRDRTVHHDTRIEDGAQSIRFEIQPMAIDAWLSGEIMFEIVLESARFTCYRHPEMHDPKIWEVLRKSF